MFVAVCREIVAVTSPWQPMLVGVTSPETARPRVEPGPSERVRGSNMVPIYWRTRMQPAVGERFNVRLRVNRSGVLLEVSARRVGRPDATACDSDARILAPCSFGP